MTEDLQLLKKLYNAFDPFGPLPPGDPGYVDCQNVRGDSNILEELGTGILLSDQMTCQLYAGHRGVGKSTELLRLKKYLEDNNYKVIYFAADEEDIDPQDTQYTDILLGLSRHLLEELKNAADPSPVITWLKDRWNSLKDLAMTEIVFEKLDISAQISQFAKLSATLRAVPGSRQKIREQVDTHILSFVEALNEFIRNAVKNLADNGKNGLLVIADNLDRIVPVCEDIERGNLDEIFINHSEQLRALECHVIYTVPLPMVYSYQGTMLEDRFGSVQVLPMIMINTSDQKTYQPGMDKLKEIIEKRLYRASSGTGTESAFENLEALNLVCNKSGGHIRNLMLLMKTSIQRTVKLPITTKAVNRAIMDLRDTYRRTVYEEEWRMLARVYLKKQLPNDDDYRKLLFNRCILEYREVVQDTLITWHDIHPLIEEIEQFKDALNIVRDRSMNL